MRLPLFVTFLFLVALAVVQSHPNVRRRGQEEGGLSPGSDFSATKRNPYSTTFGGSGQTVLANSGANTIQKYSAPETVAVSTQAANPDTVELSSNVSTTAGEINQAAETTGNQAATTGESNPAATAVQSEEAGATGEGNQGDTTGEGNASTDQTNTPNDQDGTGAPAQTQDTTTSGTSGETNQSGTEGGANTYSTENQDTATSGNSGETNQSGTEGEPAQVPDPTPTETNAGGTYQQGDQETVVETRPGIGDGESTPATSPTQDAYATEVENTSPSEAAVADSPTPAPTVDYYASSNNKPTQEKDNYEDPPWGNTVKDESTDTYEPPDDDPVDEGTDGEVENDWEDKTPAEIAKKDLEEAEKQIEEAFHDKYVPIVSAVCGVIAFFFMIFVAQQMIENPDGCCAKICRCSVACFRILCCPCRYICCCGGSRAKARRTHELVMNDTGSYGNGNYGYTHDLELT